MDCSLPGSSVHGDSPSKNTGVGCHGLLQKIFPAQGIIRVWMVVKILRKNEMAVAEHISEKRDQPRSPRKTNRKEWAAEEESPTNT